MAGKNRHHLLDRDLAFQQLRHGRDGTARNAARINRFEVAQISGHVQSKPVHGDPFSDTDSDRCQFAFIGPDPGQALPSADAQAKVADGPDEAFLQVSQVQMNVTPSSAQIQNRVTNQLTGTMVSNVSSAGNVDGGNRFLTFDFYSGKFKLRSVSLSPDGEYVRVLEQKRSFPDSVRGSRTRGSVSASQGLSRSRRGPVSRSALFHSNPGASAPGSDSRQ